MRRSIGTFAAVAVMALGAIGEIGCRSGGWTPAPRPASVNETVARKLTHDETLAWIAGHHAWRSARKTKPIWARAVAPDEVGKEFQTADHAVERATADYWLCVGTSNEPWFQKKGKIDAKYRRTGHERRQFAFDAEPHEYGVFVPREGARNWAAHVDDPGIAGFYIQPNFPSDGPLYSPRGGYVVTDWADDPYRIDPKDVWLVQQEMFESTYELAP